MRDRDDSLFDDIGRELRRDAVDPAVDRRVMSAVRDLPRHRPLGLWGRMNRARTVRVHPVSWGLVAACALVVSAFGGAGVSRLRSGGRAGEVDIATPPGTHRVQFLLVAPRAKKVSVVGDFNGWDKAHTAYQAKDRGGGVWTVTAPVPVGHHRYSFVVDDTVWVADPNAPRAVDSSFGFPSSAIIVGGSP